LSVIEDISVFARCL